MWYTIVILVPAGQGDYGSTRRCVADGQMFQSTMVRTVACYEAGGSLVEVYRGKHHGVRIYCTPPHQETHKASAAFC